MPDALAHGQRVNLLCEVVPALGPLENTADNVQFTVDRRIRPSCCLAFADVADNLRGSHAPHGNHSETLVDWLHTLPLRLNAARRKVRDAIREEPLRRLGEGKPGEVVFGGSELASFRLSDQHTFLALRFAPVASVERESEPLAVHKEMRVPGATALFECHAFSSWSL
ncbi:hypothetical protein [Tunturiibacter gelidiferens]|uniref:hypothetical protein n=1 Tax=Tunturiibacter gelidiferens TaxID=3069689 RepID=UPI003D9BEF16